MRGVAKSARRLVPTLALAGMILSANVTLAAPYHGTRTRESETTLSQRVQTKVKRLVISVFEFLGTPKG